ncbi:Ankyrin-3 [Araneus ventricosus]|uniref:Alpha-latrotoxin n=1 Tax=Araneus ventricosus TaxID=182803 RepID=A0A4Y2R4R7_ARAVE|nr:Ankyrin-3 [Araneus ventricosus]
MDFRRAFPINLHDYRDSNLAGIQEFLERGGDPNYQVYSGITVFHEAVRLPSNNIGVVRELINAGADVNCRTHLDLTPLHFTVTHRKQQIVNALIESGASVNAKDFLGRTSLHLAVTKWVLYLPPITLQMQPNIWVIDKLLKHKDIDYNLVNSNGETPLMVAVKDQQIEAVELLLGNEANPNVCNNVSETPLHVAFSLPPNSIEFLLLLSGASIYPVDKKGQTPLDILIKNGLDSRTNERVMLILKVIAFRYSITSDLKQKFELIPRLSQFFNKCCDEVDHMKGDFISGNISMHDFFWHCFDESDFKFLLLQIHKPVVERLVRDIYSEYFIEILDMIPKFSLYSILQMTACSKKRGKAKGKAKDLADLLSMLDVIYLFSKYLSYVDIFCLIVAFSDVIIAESMQNLHKRDFFHIFDLN